MEIKIDDEVLRSVRSMKEEKALRIIAQTTKAMINGKAANVKRKDRTITADVPTDLGDGKLAIALMNKEGKTVALLGYDQAAKKFLQQEEDEEDEED